VPEPHKGVSLTPVIALDFASLYPSIIMAHNLSPENVIEDCDISEVVDNYSELYSQVILKDGTARLCNRVTVDFEKDARRASIKAYVLAREEGVGVYPGILQDLFNKRAQVKKILEAIDE
jgi:DNA polymerase elongation subunit (family B)